MLKKVLTVAALCALGATAVLAQDVIAQRKDLMKQVGAATGPLGRMNQGQIPFDLAAVQNSLKVYQEKAAAAPALFPAGSDQGDTKLQPAALAERDKFVALFAKFGADATAAAAAIKDEASFKAELPKVLSNCGGCHTPYRKS